MRLDTCRMTASLVIAAIALSAAFSLASPRDAPAGPTLQALEEWSLVFDPPGATGPGIYDPLRDRLLVQASGDLWQLPLAGGAWSPLGVSGAVPEGSAVYDPVRDRMIVCQGGAATAVTLSGPPVASPIAISGSPPAGFTGAAVYDPVDDRVVVVGYGTDSGTEMQLWSFALSAGPAWQQLGGAGPLLRRGFSVVYDAARHDVVLFGGRTDAVSNAYMNEAWKIDLPGGAWSEIVVGGILPTGRYLHSAIYDPAGERMVVFGGTLGHVVNNENWALSLAGTPSWTHLGSAIEPPDRCRQVAVYDGLRAREVVFGGGPHFERPGFTDTWAFDLAGAGGWAAIGPDGTWPATRRGHTTVYDRPRNRMILFGGHDGTRFLNDAWMLHLNPPRRWERLEPSGTPPSARYLHAAIMDPDGGRMIVFGGFDGSDYLGDTWQLTLDAAPAWSPLAASGGPPSPRAGHTAVMDPIRRQMVVFGGSVGLYTRLNDARRLSLTGPPVWFSVLATSPKPEARWWHSAVYDAARDRMIVFGGQPGGDGFLDDLWALSPAGVWTQLAPAGPIPGARYGHTAVVDEVGDRMIVHDGLEAGAYPQAETWALDLASPAWEAVPREGSPPPGPLAFHSAVYDAIEGQMIVFGGDVTGSLNAVPRRLRLAGPLDVPADGAPPRRLSLAVGPQPCRGEARIVFDLPAAGRARVRVHDLAGRAVVTLADGTLGPGRHEIRWRPSGATPGVYWVRLDHAGATAARRIVLVHR